MVNHAYNNYKGIEYHPNSETSFPYSSTYAEFNFIAPSNGKAILIMKCSWWGNTLDLNYDAWFALSTTSPGGTISVVSNSGYRLLATNITNYPSGSASSSLYNNFHCILEYEYLLTGLTPGNTYIYYPIFKAYSGDGGMIKVGEKYPLILKVLTAP